MAKKNTDNKKQTPNFDGLIGGEIPEPIIEPSTKELKSKTSTKKAKTGPVPITPKEWIETYIKLDPKIKKEAKKYIALNEGYTLSTLINEALKMKLKIK